MLGVDPDRLEYPIRKRVGINRSEIEAPVVPCICDLGSVFFFFLTWEGPSTEIDASHQSHRDL